MATFVSVDAFRKVILVAGVGVLWGCQSITEKLTEKAVETVVETAIEKETGGDVDIDTKNQGFSIRSKNSKGEEVVMNGQSGKLPDNWPSFVPAYPGAKVTGSFMTGKNGVLVMETADSPDKVLAFYKANKGSMTEGAQGNMGDMSIVTFEDKAAGKQIALGAKAEDGKTVISLQVAGN